MENIVVLTAMYETFYASVFVNQSNKVAFGPLIFGRTPTEAHEKADAFIFYLVNRFPYVDISHINTQRLCTYYKEHLDDVNKGS